MLKKALFIDRSSVVVTALFFAVSACATIGPSRELLDARRTYANAKDSNAAKLKPDEMLDAEQALRAAEAAHKDDPGSNEERHLAYLAKRRTEVAMSRGRRALLLNEYHRKHEMLVSQAKTYAVNAKSELNKANKELSQEKEKLQEAEKRASKALQDLKQIAMVKEEERGLVITLSGAVLFRSGESELLSTARTKLQQVAEALKQQNNKNRILIEGHTDSQGSAAYNEGLSYRRAQTVRNFLVIQGVDPSRLEVMGMGETQPIADNNSPEGRANNRRVEIIIKKS